MCIISEDILLILVLNRFKSEWKWFLNRKNILKVMYMYIMWFYKRKKIFLKDDVWVLIKKLFLKFWNVYDNI